MLEVQEYLLTHSLEQLSAEHGVDYRISNRVWWKFTLNYDQHRVKNSNTLTHECRGLVLGQSEGKLDPNKPVGRTHIMARPFKRFFNQGQACATEVDFNDASFFEKLDGTLCILYSQSHGVWDVATRGTPDADIPLHGDGLTFRSLFKKAVIDTYGDNFGRDNVIDAWAEEYNLDHKYTYMFELTAPENQVVVRYPERRIRLLAIRWTESGEELDPENTFMTCGLEACPRVKATPENLLQYIQEQNPATFEGVIVRGNKRDADGTFPRVKVKHPGYDALSKVAGTARSPRAQMELVLMGKHDDVRPIVPADVYERMRRMLDGLLRYCERLNQIQSAAWFKLEHCPAMDAKAQRKQFVAIVRAYDGHYLPFHMAAYDDSFLDAWRYWQQNKKEGAWIDTTLDFLIEKST